MSQTQKPTKERINTGGEDKSISQSIHLFFQEPNLGHIKESLKELKEGKGVVHDLIEVSHK